MKLPRGRTADTGSRIQSGVLIWVFALLTAFAAHAGSDSGPAPRYPFLPELTVNEEPALCEAFLAASREAFLSAKYSVDIEGKLWPGLSEDRMKWIFSRPQFNGYERERPADYKIHLTMIDETPVDLDGDGSNEILVLTSWEHSWRGFNYGLAILPSKQTFQKYLELSEAGKPTDHLGVVKVAGLDAWTLPATLAFDGRAYLAELLPHIKDWGASKFTLARLTPQGKSPEVCVVSFVSSSPLAGMPNSVLKVGKLLGSVAGGECGGGGTMQSAARLSFLAGSTTSRLLYRPWATIGFQPYNSSGQVHSYLDGWAYDGVGGLGSWRLYQDLNETYRNAVIELRSYYATAFGSDAAYAQVLAEANMDWFLRHHFKFTGAGYQMPQERWGKSASILMFHDYLTGAREDSHIRLLRRMVLERMSINDIDRVLDTYRERGGTREGQANLPLDAALEYPQALQRFLFAGADVNQTNPFGKTPLMYAAHYDLPQAANILLKEGADPNLRTTKLINCPYYVQTGGRSALTYALENASVGLIQMLLEHGADVLVTDTYDRDIFKYLMVNKNLTDPERARVHEMLLEKGAAP